MPALPASAEEATGKVPLTPDCTATTLTGARQRGCVGVAVGVGLEDSVVDDVAVPVRDCELLDVPVRVAELLGVDVPVEVGVELDEREAELLGVDVPVEVGVVLDEREAELLGVDVPDGDGVAVPVSDCDSVLGIRVVVNEDEGVALDDAVCEAGAANTRMRKLQTSPMKTLSSASTATETGELSSAYVPAPPSPLNPPTPDPATVTIMPVEMESKRMRLLPVSAMTRLPVASMATPCG